MTPIRMRMQRWFKDWVSTVPILKLRAALHEESLVTLNYLVLLISSCLIATFGLIVDSAAVIIGAMIIAPLMQPLRGFAFGILEGDTDLIRSASLSVFVGTVIGVLFSYLAGLTMSLPEYGPQVLARTAPTLVDLLIALAAGVIAAVAKVRPEVGDALPGTAIAVALMPPLCVVGLTLSQGQYEHAWLAFLLYLTNLLGINFACMVVYVVAGYTQSSKRASLRRTASWGVSAALIGALTLPLGVATVNLIDRTRKEHLVRSSLDASQLLQREDVHLVSFAVQVEPPIIHAVVRASSGIARSDIVQLENWLEQQLGSPQTVNLDIIQSRRIQLKVQPRETE